MKRISMVIIQAFATLVSAYSRTPYQSKGQNAQMLTQSRQNEAQKAFQEGILSRIASTANNSLRKFPSSPQIENIENPQVRRILERGRKLLEAGKAATEWNVTQLIDFASDQYIKEAEAVANSNQATAKTSQEECGVAKDKCYRVCHRQDKGYFCFFDCRLEYMACLVDSVIRG